MTAAETAQSRQERYLAAVAAGDGDVFADHVQAVQVDLKRTLVDFVVGFEEEIPKAALYRHAGVVGMAVQLLEEVLDLRRKGEIAWEGEQDPPGSQPAACDASAGVERLTSCLRLIEGAVSTALDRAASGQD